MSMLAIVVGAVLAAGKPQVAAVPDAAAIGEALALAAGLKTAVAEYRMTYGKWPAQADPAVVELPGNYAGNYVTSIDLAADGVLRVTFKRSVGGMHVELTPDERPYGIVWSCTSPDIADIASMSEGCTYAR